VRGIIIHRAAGVGCAGRVRGIGFSIEEYVRQCEEIVDRFRLSELMQRVKREFCKLPFVVTISGVWVTGSIDRLCDFSEGSWVVIEYKSEGALDYAALVDEYALSLSVYVEAARQIVGAGVVGWLYFTETEGVWKAGIPVETFEETLPDNTSDVTH